MFVYEWVRSSLELSLTVNVTWWNEVNIVNPTWFGSVWKIRKSNFSYIFATWQQCHFSLAKLRWSKWPNLWPKPLCDVINMVVYLLNNFRSHDYHCTSDMSELKILGRTYLEHSETKTKYLSKQTKNSLFEWLFNAQFKTETHCL